MWNFYTRKIRFGILTRDLLMKWWFLFKLYFLLSSDMSHFEFIMPQWNHLPSLDEFWPDSYLLWRHHQNDLLEHFGRIEVHLKQLSITTVSYFRFERSIICLYITWHKNGGEIRVPTCFDHSPAERTEYCSFFWCTIIT